MNGMYGVFGGKFLGIHLKNRLIIIMYPIVFIMKLKHGNDNLVNIYLGLAICLLCGVKFSQSTYWVGHLTVVNIKA